jgi:hypothetical protein
MYIVVEGLGFLCSAKLYMQGGNSSFMFVSTIAVFIVNPAKKKLYADDLSIFGFGNFLLLK